jgi:hypothetical protein
MLGEAAKVAKRSTFTSLEKRAVGFDDPRRALTICAIRGIVSHMLPSAKKSSAFVG